MKKGFTILSTKKLHQSILDKAEENGIAVIDEDFIEVKYKVNGAIAKSIEKISEYIVFTSRHAVDALLKNAAVAGVTIPFKKIFCLSGETRKAVEKLEKKEILGVAPNAAELARIIVKEKPQGSVHFICGEKRRDELPLMLKASNIKLIELQVYETVLSGKLVTVPYDAVLFFSPSGVGSYFQTNILPKDIPCFCIGETTAASATEHCSGDVYLAEDPSQKSIMESVIQYFNTKGKLKNT